MRRIFNNIRNHSNWLGYYAFKYLKSNKKEGFTFNCRGGLNVEVPERLLQTYKECFFDETYFKGLPEKIQGGPFSTVVDIGANVGYFSLFMLSKYPKAKVLAFEPMPVNYKLLTKYKQNNRNLDFTVINEAVSSGKGAITLNYDSTDSFTTDASIFSNNQKDSIEVKTLGLADVIKENNLEKIDFLKLDCEGSEYSILYNSPKSVLEMISVISIETHIGVAENENTESLINFLKENNFAINRKGDIVWAWKTK